MKDLIVISAHCSSLEKRNSLNKLINSLQSIRNDYDLMVVSHLPISSDISEKVNYSFYDSDNIKISDWGYLNSPWLFLGGEYVITSVFFCTYGSKSNYLAIYRLIIMAYSFAKSFGYKKVHYLEYDCYLENFDELYDNTKLLDEYDAVMYTRSDKNNNSPSDVNTISIPVGHFHSTRVDNINSLFTTYEPDKLLNLLSQCAFKTNEYVTEKIYKMDDRRIYYKNHKLLETNNSYFNKSADIELLSDPIPWIAPYYDEEIDSICVIYYNNVKNYVFQNLNVIVNDNILYHVSDLQYSGWVMYNIGDLKDINKIAIYVNDKLTKTIILNEENKKYFRCFSNRSKSKSLTTI